MEEFEAMETGCAEEVEKRKEAEKGRREAEERLRVRDFLRS